MLSAGSFGSSGGFCVGAGGFTTGTVILSAPGSSAFFGGSCIWLPPPPPPPPGPGWFNQTMSFGYCVGWMGPLRSGRRRVPDDEQRDDEEQAVRGERAADTKAGLPALERERQLGRVQAVDLHRDVSVACYGGTRRLFGHQAIHCNCATTRPGLRDARKLPSATGTGGRGSGPETLDSRRSCPLTATPSL
jgi:hypothetical protein